MDTRTPHAHTPLDDVYAAAHQAWGGVMADMPDYTGTPLEILAKEADTMARAVRAAVDAALAATLYCTGCLQVLAAPWSGLVLIWREPNLEEVRHVHSLPELEALVDRYGRPCEIQAYGGTAGLYAVTLVRGEPRCSVCMSH